MTELFLISLAGSLGSGARYLLDKYIKARLNGLRWHYWPLGTGIVNCVGSFLLGLTAGATQSGSNTFMLAIIGTGFCGGFTTFSTYCLDLARGLGLIPFFTQETLMSNSRKVGILLWSLLQLVTAISCCYVGLTLTLRG